jgi:hypothetical protein
MVPAPWKHCVRADGRLRDGTSGPVHFAQEAALWPPPCVASSASGHGRQNSRQLVRHSSEGAPGGVPLGTKAYAGDIAPGGCVLRVATGSLDLVAALRLRVDVTISVWFSDRVKRFV